MNSTSNRELAAEGAEMGVAGCQFVTPATSNRELAAEGAEMGVAGCQFGTPEGDRND